MYNLKTNTVNYLKSYCTTKPIMHNKTVQQQNDTSTICAAPTVYPCNKDLKQQLPKTNKNIFETVTTTDLPGLTEWLLPSNICQTHIYEKQLTSNACTVL